MAVGDFLFQSPQYLNWNSGNSNLINNTMQIYGIFEKARITT